MPIQAQPIDAPSGGLIAAISAELTRACLYTRNRLRPKDSNQPQRKASGTTRQPGPEREREPSEQTGAIDDESNIHAIHEFALKAADVTLWRWSPATSSDSAIDSLEQTIGSISPAHRTGMVEALQTCGADRADSQADVYVSSDNQPRWLRISIRAASTADGDFDGYLGSAIDITDLKDAEASLRSYREHLEKLVAERSTDLDISHEQLRLKERLASIGTLASGLGHDIGNLILPILCRLDFLAAQDLPGRVCEELDAVRASVMHLRRLSTGLRLFALDPDDPTASAEATHIHAWWAQAGPLLQNTLPRRISLEHDFPDHVPPIALPPHQFTQALFNLIVNAGEAISGQGQVRLWCAPLADNNGMQRVRVCVTDTGAGMDDEVRRQALDPFFTTKKRTLSTGLGLSIVRGIVESAGGEVSLETGPGQGTTASITLPVAPAAAQSTPQQGRNDAHTEPSLGLASANQGLSRLARVTVDDQRLASYAASLLEASGFAPITGGEPVENANADEILWLVAPDRVTLESAQRFLSNRPDRKVIVVGAPQPDWTEPGVIAVDGSYRQLRQAFRLSPVQALGALS